MESIFPSVSRTTHHASCPSSIYMPAQCFTHHLYRRIPAAPKFERCRALVKQHPKPIGDAAAGGAGGLQQRRLGGTIYHVVNGASAGQGKLGGVERQRIRRLETKRRPIER